MTPSSQLPRLLQDADFILDSCGRKVLPNAGRYVGIPAFIGHTRFMPFVTNGNNTIAGIQHKRNVSFWLRSMTAQMLPRSTQGTYWRLKFPSGRYFQSSLSSHALSFGFGSDRLVFAPEVEWAPGEKLFVDLSTAVVGTPPSTGYTIVMQFEGEYRFPISGGPVAHPLGLNLPKDQNGFYYRYFDTPNQNILAPESMWGSSCPSETPPGYWDEEYKYVTPNPVDLPCTGDPVSNVQEQMEPDSDFICREIWPFFPGGANQGTGNVVIRFRRGDGYVISSNFIPINSIKGPIGIRELKIKAGDSLYWDAYVVDGSGPTNVLTFGLYLFGVRRRRL